MTLPQSQKTFSLMPSNTNQLNYKILQKLLNMVINIIYIYIINLYACLDPALEDPCAVVHRMINKARR